jgi:hypothetical protein
VADTPLEGLEAEFGGIQIVFALCRFDQLRADKSFEIYCV